MRDEIILSDCMHDDADMGWMLVCHMDRKSSTCLSTRGD